MNECLRDFPLSAVLYIVGYILVGFGMMFLVILKTDKVGLTNPQDTGIIFVALLWPIAVPLLWLGYIFRDKEKDKV